VKIEKMNARTTEEWQGYLSWQWPQALRQTFIMTQHGSLAISGKIV
jgi:hypothetical protein